MNTKSILIILTLVLFYSCKSNDKQHENNLTTFNDFKSLDTAVSFSGYWVSEDYYNSIAEFKSPNKGQNSSQCIFIPDRTLKQTVMIYQFHEGGPFLKVLKNQKNYEIWEVQDDSLIQRVNEIEIISPTKITIGGKMFIKVNAIPTKDDYLILEEMLFKGIYTNSSGNTIEFKNNRQLIGLDNYSYYYPIIDYFEPGLDIDQVGLGSSKNDLENFGFKFNKDTLELYKINCLTFDSTDNMCTEVGYGQLAYKLWRKK